MIRVLSLLLAAASVAPGVPIEETFYQFLSPDGTTVLCDSRTAGACDPFLAELDVFFFGADSELSLSPTQLTSETRLFMDLGDADSNYLIRMSHFFENEIDLGWYMFEGGTGDFLAQYLGSGSFDSPSSGVRFTSALDPGPFPVASGGVDVYSRATFGQPFRLRAQYTANYEGLFHSRGIASGGGVSQQTSFLWGYDLNFNPLPFLVEIVPVPEPAGLSLFGFIAILLGRVAMRTTHIAGRREDRPSKLAAPE